jgi:hypothetical protein
MYLSLSRKYSVEKYGTHISGLGSVSARTSRDEHQRSETRACSPFFSRRFAHPHGAHVVRTSLAVPAIYLLHLHSPRPRGAHAARPRTGTTPPLRFPHTCRRERLRSLGGAPTAVACRWVALQHVQYKIYF